MDNMYSRRNGYWFPRWYQRGYGWPRTARKSFRDGRPSSDIDLLPETELLPPQNPYPEMAWNNQYDRESHRNRPQYENEGYYQQNRHEQRNRYENKENASRRDMNERDLRNFLNKRSPSKSPKERERYSGYVDNKYHGKSPPKRHRSRSPHRRYSRSPKSKSRRESPPSRKKAKLCHSRRHRKHRERSPSRDRWESRRRESRSRSGGSSKGYEAEPHRKRRREDQRSSTPSFSSDSDKNWDFKRKKCSRDNRHNDNFQPKKKNPYVWVNPNLNTKDLSEVSSEEFTSNSQRSFEAEEIDDGDDNNNDTLKSDGTIADDKECEETAPGNNETDSSDKLGSKHVTESEKHERNIRRSDKTTQKVAKESGEKSNQTFLSNTLKPTVVLHKLELDKLKTKPEATIDSEKVIEKARSKRDKFSKVDSDNLNKTTLKHDATKNQNKAEEHRESQNFAKNKKVNTEKEHEIGRKLREDKTLKIQSDGGKENGEFECEKFDKNEDGLNRISFERSCENQSKLAEESANKETENGRKNSSTEAPSNVQNLENVQQKDFEQLKITLKESGNNEKGVTSMVQTLLSYFGKNKSGKESHKENGVESNKSVKPKDAATVTVENVQKTSEQKVIDLEDREKERKQNENFIEDNEVDNNTVSPNNSIRLVSPEVKHKNKCGKIFQGDQDECTKLSVDTQEHKTMINTAEVNIRSTSPDRSITPPPYMTQSSKQNKGYYFNNVHFQNNTNHLSQSMHTGYPKINRRNDLRNESKKENKRKRPQMDLNQSQSHTFSVADKKRIFEAHAMRTDNSAKENHDRVSCENSRGKEIYQKTLEHVSENISLERGGQSLNSAGEDLLKKSVEKSSAKIPSKKDHTAKSQYNGRRKSVEPITKTLHSEDFIKNDQLKTDNFGNASSANIEKSLEQASASKKRHQSGSKNTNKETCPPASPDSSGTEINKISSPNSSASKQTSNVVKGTINRPSYNLYIPLGKGNEKSSKVTAKLDRQSSAENISMPDLGMPDVLLQSEQNAKKCVESGRVRKNSEDDAEQTIIKEPLFAKNRPRVSHFNSREFTLKGQRQMNYSVSHQEKVGSSNILSNVTAPRKDIVESDEGNLSEKKKSEIENQDSSEQKNTRDFKNIFEKFQNNSRKSKETEKSKVESNIEQKDKLRYSSGESKSNRSEKKSARKIESETETGLAELNEKEKDKTERAAKSDADKTLDKLIENKSKKEQNESKGKKLKKEGELPGRKSVCKIVHGAEIPGLNMAGIEGAETNGTSRGKEQTSDKLTENNENKSKNKQNENKGKQNKNCELSGRKEECKNVHGADKPRLNMTGTETNKMSKIEMRDKEQTSDRQHQEQSKKSNTPREKLESRTESETTTSTKSVKKLTEDNASQSTLENTTVTEDTSLRAVHTTLPKCIPVYKKLFKPNKTKSTEVQERVESEKGTMVVETKQKHLDVSTNQEREHGETSTVEMAFPSNVHEETIDTQDNSDKEEEDIEPIQMLGSVFTNEDYQTIGDDTNKIDIAASNTKNSKTLSDSNVEDESQRTMQFNYCDDVLQLEYNKEDDDVESREQETKKTTPRKKFAETLKNISKKLIETEIPVQQQKKEKPKRRKRPKKLEKAADPSVSSDDDDDELTYTSGVELTPRKLPKSQHEEYVDKDQALPEKPLKTPPEEWFVKAKSAMNVLKRKKDAGIQDTTISAAQNRRDEIDGSSSSSCQIQPASPPSHAATTSTDRNSVPLQHNRSAGSSSSSCQIQPASRPPCEASTSSDRNGVPSQHSGSGGAGSSHSDLGALTANSPPAVVGQPHTPDNIGDPSKSDAVGSMIRTSPRNPTLVQLPSEPMFNALTAPLMNINVNLPNPSLQPRSLSAYGPPVSVAHDQNGMVSLCRSSTNGGTGHLLPITESTVQNRNCTEQLNGPTIAMKTRDEMKQDFLMLFEKVDTGDSRADMIMVSTMMQIRALQQMHDEDLNRRQMTMVEECTRSIQDRIGRKKK